MRWFQHWWSSSIQNLVLDGMESVIYFYWITQSIRQIKLRMNVRLKLLVQPIKLSKIKPIWTVVHPNVWKVHTIRVLIASKTKKCTDFWHCWSCSTENFGACWYEVAEIFSLYHTKWFSRWNFACTLCWNRVCMSKQVVKKIKLSWKVDLLRVWKFH